MNVSFSVNSYDYEGDIMETGIFLHFDNVRIKVANNIKEYREFVNQLDTITDELYDTFPNIRV